MTFDDKIRHEKLQYDVNIEPTEISVLSSEKIEKQECFTGKETLSSGQGRVIEEARFAYSTLRKASKNKQKTIEDEREKQIEAIKNRVEKQLLDTDKKSNTTLFSKDVLTEEAMYQSIKITKIKKEINRNDLIHKTGNRKKVKKFEEKFVMMNILEKMHLENKKKSKTGLKN